jgi:hypothetical protein
MKRLSTLIASYSDAIIRQFYLIYKYFSEKGYFLYYDSVLADFRLLRTMSDLK